jgi:hypothetical protein
MGQSIEFDPDLSAWERQPKETAKAYAAFEVYRDLGPQRSLAGAYRLNTGRTKAKKAPGGWTAWYNANLWRERAEAYDRHQASQRLREREKAIADANERQAAIGRQMQHLGIASMHGHDYECTLPDGKKVKLPPLTPTEARRYVVAGISIERKALGIPDVLQTQITGAGSGPVQHSIVGIRIVMPDGTEVPDED